MRSKLNSLVVLRGYICISPQFNHLLPSVLKLYTATYICADINVLSKSTTKNVLNQLQYGVSVYDMFIFNAIVSKLPIAYHYHGRKIATRYQRYENAFDKEVSQICFPDETTSIILHY